MIIMIISERVETYLQPYKLPENNAIEILAIVAGIVTLNAGYVYQQNEEISNLNLIVLIVVVSVNSKFILDWIYQLLECFQDRFYKIRLIYLCLAKVLCRKPKVKSKENRKKTDKTKSVKTSLRLSSEPEILESPKIKHKRRIKMVRRNKAKRRIKNRRTKRKAHKNSKFPEQAANSIADHALNSINNMTSQGFLTSNFNNPRF